MTVSVAGRPHYVRLQNPGAPVADGRGGYTQVWADLNPPRMFAGIRAATAQATSMETSANDTVRSTATHLIDLPYHPQVTTKTRVTLTTPARGEQTFTVTSVDNVDQANKDLVLVAVEVVA